MELNSLSSLQKNLAHHVKQRRRVLSISQEQLAFESSVDRTYISQIERGIGNPSLLVLSKIADALRMSVLELLTSPEKPESSVI